MCISASVGKKGRNLKNDVKTIQILLNENISKLIPYAPLPEDGKLSDQLTAMIEEFQRRKFQESQPVAGKAFVADGKVDANGKTLQHLREGLPDGFTEAKLQGIMINASTANISRYFSALKSGMITHSINTPLRMAHFLAQLGHESGEFLYTEEIASGAAYEGRKDLGNTETGDGKRFKGRGLIQLTGRANYKKYGEYKGEDFTTDAGAQRISTDPSLAVDVACWFWSTHSLNELADANNVERVTRRINGGLNGLADRKVKLARAKFFFNVK